MRHSLSLPTVTYTCTSVWESFHIFTMTRQRPFCTLSRCKLLQVDQGSSVPLAKCSFGMIPLSRHSVDRSPWAFHSSTHNVVRASCFEVVRASVESRKLFLDGSLCLAGLAMEWVSRVIFLEAAICVAGYLSAYVGRSYPRQCIQFQKLIKYKKIYI